MDAAGRSAAAGTLEDAVCQWGWRGPGALVGRAEPTCQLGAAESACAVCQLVCFCMAAALSQLVWFPLVISNLWHLAYNRCKVLDHFEMTLTAKLREIAQFRYSSTRKAESKESKKDSKKDQIIKDQGVSSIYGDETYKETRLFIKDPPAGLHLNYVGHVTRTPHAGALRCCSAFGIEFYVTGSGVSNLSKETFVPAWLIKPNLKVKIVKGTMMALQ